MPIAAGVVRDLGIAASRVLAACDMPAERRGATALDRTHHLQLLEAHMPAVGLAPGRTVIAENVRDLQSWSSHGRRRYGAAGSLLSRLVRLRRGALRSSRARQRRQQGKYNWWGKYSPNSPSGSPELTDTMTYGTGVGGGQGPVTATLNGSAEVHGEAKLSIGVTSQF